MTRRSLFAALAAAGGLPVAAKTMAAPERLIEEPAPLIPPEDWIAKPRRAFLSDLELELVRRPDLPADGIEFLQRGRTYNILLRFREEQTSLAVEHVALSGQMIWMEKGWKHWRYHLETAETPLAFLPDIMRTLRQ